MIIVVRFSESIKQLPSTKKLKRVDSILEIGPHSTLQGTIRERLKDITANGAVEYYSCIQRSSSTCETFLTTVGKLHCRGHRVEFSKLSEAPLSKDEGLLEYPFDDTHTYWPNTLQDFGYRFRGKPRNDLLGTRSTYWNPLDAR